MTQYRKNIVENLKANILYILNYNYNFELQKEFPSYFDLEEHLDQKINKISTETIEALIEYKDGKLVTIYSNKHLKNISKFIKLRKFLNDDLFKKIELKLEYNHKI